MVLAACGLDRLGLGDEIGARLDPEVMLPEAGQGALAMQVRAGEEVLVASSGRRRDEAAGRGGAALCRCRRRWVPGAGRRTPRWWRPHGADRGRGRELGGAAATATTRTRSAASSLRSRGDARRLRGSVRRPRTCSAPRRSARVATASGRCVRESRQLATANVLYPRQSPRVTTATGSGLLQPARMASASGLCGRRSPHLATATERGLHQTARAPARARHGTQSARTRHGHVTRSPLRWASPWVGGGSGRG